MKIKTIHYVLVIISIFFAVHCRVDSQKTPFSVDSTLHPPFLNPPMPEIENEELFHIYTEEEQEQFRENLIGRYQSLFNNQETILDIRADYTYLSNQVELESSYSYFIVFSIFSEPMIVINNVGNYYIQTSPGDPTNIVGFRSVVTQISFRRLPDRMDHDEL